MVKAHVPLLSLGARGSVSKAVTFVKAKGNTVAKVKSSPGYRRSLLQQYQRWLFQDAHFYWTTLTTAQKDEYRAFASRYHIPIYAAFMEDYLDNLPDLNGHWRLDSVVANYTADSGPNSLNALVTGATPVPAVIDNGLYCDGLDDTIKLGNSPLIAPAAVFTQEFFFTFGAVAQGDRRDLMYKSGTWNFSYDGAGYASKVRPYFVGLSTPGLTSNKADFVAGRRYHFAITYDKDGGADNYRLNIDGILDKALTVTGLVTISNSHAYLSGPYYFAYGTYDHVAYWSRVLSPLQLQLHAQRRYP